MQHRDTPRLSDSDTGHRPDHLLRDVWEIASGGGALRLTDCEWLMDRLTARAELQS